MLEISVEQRKQLIAYLQSKPFNEVYVLMTMLMSLKPIDNGKKDDSVTPKN